MDKDNYVKLCQIVDGGAEKLIGEITSSAPKSPVMTKSS
jgi:hypothetical protein